MSIEPGQWFSVSFEAIYDPFDFGAYVGRSIVPELNLELRLYRNNSLHISRHYPYLLMNMTAFVAKDELLLTENSACRTLSLLPNSIEVMLVVTKPSQLSGLFRPTLEMRYRKVVYIAEVFLPKVVGDEFIFGDKWRLVSETEYKTLFFDPENISDINSLEFRLLY